VTATSQDTGSARTVTANAQGEYRIDGLAVGDYTLEVNAKNFKRFLQKAQPVLRAALFSDVFVGQVSHGETAFQKKRFGTWSRRLPRA
jgi:hypothetical protein